MFKKADHRCFRDNSDPVTLLQPKPLPNTNMNTEDPNTSLSEISSSEITFQKGHSMFNTFLEMNNLLTFSQLIIIHSCKLYTLVMSFSVTDKHNLFILHFYFSIRSNYPSKTHGWIEPGEYIRHRSEFSRTSFPRPSQLPQNCALC